MCVAAVLLCLHSVKFKRASSVARKPCVVQIANSYYKFAVPQRVWANDRRRCMLDDNHNVRVMAIGGSKFFLLSQIAYDEHSHDNDDDGGDDEDA